MQPTHTRFKDIHYKKITWEEFDKFTSDLIKDICRIDNLFHRKPDDLRNYLTRRKEEKTKTIFYLMYNGEELLGVSIGHLRKASELYIKENPNANFFHLAETFIHPKYQGEGLGTLLMARVVADQRVKHKSKFIYMSAFPETQSINKKITGKRPLIVSIENRVKTREVLRNFDNSKFKYDLISIPESKENPGPSKKQFILINENPNYKKKVIRSRAK